MLISVSMPVDRDLDGTLSKEEVALGYENMFSFDLVDVYLDDLFSRIDTHGTGTIDYSEFVVACLNEKLVLGNDKLKEAVS